MAQLLFANPVWLLQNEEKKIFGGAVFTFGTLRREAHAAQRARYCLATDGAQMDADE